MGQNIKSLAACVCVCVRALSLGKSFVRPLGFPSSQDEAMYQI